MVFRDVTDDGTVRLTGGAVAGGGEPGEPGPPGAPGAPGTNGTPGEVIFPFQANGVLTAKIWPTAFYVTQSGNYRIRATCRDRGTGASLIVNVQVDGVGVLSGTDRPTITTGAGLGSDASTVTVALVAGDFITGVEVVQVGSGWTTLVVQLVKEV